MSRFIGKDGVLCDLVGGPRHKDEGIGCVLIFGIVKRGCSTSM